MTVLDQPPSDEALKDLQLGNVGQQLEVAAGEADATEAPDEELDGRPPVNPLAATAAAFLATAAVGWMLGGIFSGVLPRLVGIGGAALGAGVVALSYRMRNPSTVQFLALPLAVLAGVGLVAPSAAGTTVPSLITDAVKGGGLSQPPAPFDPGWRFLLLVLTCAIVVTAATGAVAFNRSRLAVFLPAPVIGAGVLIQPQGHELLSVAPSLALSVAALAVAFGGELSRDGDTGAKFEARRLGKAGGLLVIIVAALVGLSQLGFLYPPTHDSTVVPPKRPQTPPALTNDDVLFTVKQQSPSPLRLGVLDVYDGVAWLTPPFDPKRYVPVGDNRLPAFSPDRSRAFDTPQPAPTATVTAEVTIVKPGPGREIPDLINTTSTIGVPKGTEFDPRTQTLRLPGRGDQGTHYTVVAAKPPNGARLSVAKVPPPSLKQFTQVPAAPPAVRALLDTIPKAAGGYERLQFVRTQFFSKITAAGAGNPVDVPPARVSQFLTGTPATPYEITAPEVLLARWTGIPARIGYGYYNPEAKPGKDGRIDVRPSDGAMWLEAYFEGSGWTPILGKPPKAQSSLDNLKKKNNKQILPNGLITAQLYIPIKQQSLSLLYTIVQFWLARAAAVAGVLLFFWILLPGLIKLLRRWWRRRWAEGLGARERVAVAYAEIRDRAIDFNVGHPTLTPLEFLDVLEPDEDHVQLAWLVTRGLWGDLRRDLRTEDAEAAEMLSRSLYRRFVQGQPFLTRVIAFGSRVSLHEPWDRTLPNPYWRRSVVEVAWGSARSAIKRLRALRLLRLTPDVARSSAMVIACMVMLTGCVQQVDLSDDPARTAPLPRVPETVGDFTFEPTNVGDALFRRYHDIALISRYGFYAIRRDHVAVATLQTATFKSGLRAENRTVRAGV
ncbi:MAG: transglutaminase domain-containing protein, partial [Mycobacteriales bacterium]